MSTGYQEDPYRLVVEESERRATRTSTIDVVNVTPLSPQDLPSLGIPGAMTVFLGRKGSGVVQGLREAIDNREQRPDDIGTALEGITGGVGKEGLAQEIVRQPVFADIEYGGETLNRGIFVPEHSNLTLTAFPYNGGRVVDEGFALVEYYAEGSEAALEALVVQVSPPLTAAERVALIRVPEDQDVRNVGVAAWCDSTWWAVAGFVVSATYAVICTILAKPQLPGPISEEELARLDPTASAGELLALRREFLLKGLRQP